MANVPIDVICPCGNLLATRNLDPSSSSPIKGTIQCPCCKKKVSYTIVHGKAFTAYVN